MEEYIHLSLTQDVQHGIAVIFTCSVLVVAAAFIDMWTGIDAARANHEKISSHGLRRTVSKIMDYLRVIFFSVLIDILGLFFPWYAIPYCCILATLGVLLIEGRSVLENSRKKKSSAGEIVDMVSKIIECASHKDAEELIRIIKDNKAKEGKE